MTSVMQVRLAQPHLMGLPSELLQNIFYLCGKERRDFKVLNKSLCDVIRSSFTSLTVGKPFDSKPNYPDILREKLEKYPNVQQFSMNVHNITEYRSDLIESLVLFLNTSYPSQLTQLTLKELQWCSLTSENVLKAKTLSQEFLYCFAHSQITSLTLTGLPFQSNITGSSLSTILKKCKNLTYFSHIARKDDLLERNIQLSNCLKLRTINLIGSRYITAKTINHLRLCPNLTEICINDVWANDWGDFRIDKFFCNFYQPNLKVLNLNYSECFFEDDVLIKATEQLPNLETFSILRRSVSIDNCTDTGLVKIAENCLKLRILQFNFFRITEAGFCQFASKCATIEKITAGKARKITAVVIKALENGCKQLKTLTVIDLDKKLDQESFQSLKRIGKFESLGDESMVYNFK